MVRRHLERSDSSRLALCLGVEPLKVLRRLVKDVRAVDHKVDEKYMSRLKAKNQAARTRAEKAASEPSMPSSCQGSASR